MDVQTTIKTETCNYTELRIYPGRGKKYASLDGRVNTFINHRCQRLATIRQVKNQKLRWTISWRRAHKKAQQSAGKTTRTGPKTKRAAKAVLGLDITAIRRQLGK